MKDEGVPDIVLMMEDDIAVGLGAFSQLSGHGLVIINAQVLNTHTADLNPSIKTTMLVTPMVFCIIYPEYPNFKE